jgi:hypothetical protein
MLTRDSVKLSNTDCFAAGKCWGNDIFLHGRGACRAVSQYRMDILVLYKRLLFS